MLNLKPLLTATSSASGGGQSIGRGLIDVQKIVWQKVRLFLFIGVIVCNQLYADHKERNLSISQMWRDDDDLQEQGDSLRRSLR